MATPKKKTPRKTIPILPSRITTDGLDRAPHRAFLRGLGLTDADIAKPFIGVASTDGRVTPCNAMLGAQAQAACEAVRASGGVPFDFASISVADSMSMNHGGMRYSLPSREWIADGVEAVCRGHAYDGLVTFAGCDKTLPGMMLAMVRLNLPAVFVYGGAALPGRWRGRDVTVLDTYEAVGGVMAGTMTAQALDELEHVCLPGLGACPGQFSANTMAMVSETLGLALPGSATPAVAEGRLESRAAGAADAHTARGGGAAAAPTGDAQEPGERLRRSGGDRRLVECGAAHSGDRARGGHPLLAG
jgi:dihydroxy-acid dehydratase